MTDSATAVSATLFVAVVAPFVATLGAAAIRWALKDAVAEVKKLTGIQIQQAAVDKIDSMAESGAGAAIAAAEGNLASVAIPVGSPIVKKIVEDILKDAPAELAAAGLSPDDVVAKVHGEIGKLQAKATVVAPPVIVAAPAPKA